MATAPTQDVFLTVAEIAERLKVNQLTVRAWIDRGELQAVRAGRRVRVRPKDLETFLTAPGNGDDQGPKSDGMESPTPPLAKQPDGTAELVTALKSLTDAVQALTGVLARQA